MSRSEYDIYRFLNIIDSLFVQNQHVIFFNSKLTTPLRQEASVRNRKYITVIKQTVLALRPLTHYI